MIIENCVSFHYLVLNLGIPFKEIDIIEDFEKCIGEYNSMCSCEGEVKDMKRIQCEEKYQDIILNNMDKIKKPLLDYHNEFTFNTVHPEEKLLAFISKI
jgi:hypothetical protein